MGFIHKLTFGLIWLYRVCYLLITGLALISGIVLSVHLGILSFEMWRGTSLAQLSRMSIPGVISSFSTMLCIPAFCALAFIPSFICWVQKPVSHYLRNRGIQNPNPAPEITTPRFVKAINIFFTLFLILAGSLTVPLYREKMARSTIIRVFAVADEAKLCVENFIASHNGQTPKTISETEFKNGENRYIGSVVFNGENISLKLVLKEFYKVKAGSSLTFIKHDQGWDCFSSGIPQIHFMQRKCPEQLETTIK